MNLTIERAPALSAISRVVGVVERRHSIEILSNVALRAEGDALILRATDLDAEAIESIAANISTDGAVTMAADKLHDIVRNSESGSQVAIEIAGTDPRAKVKCGKSRFSVPTMPINGFPEFPAEDLGGEFTISGKTLASMLSRVSWATSHEKTMSKMSCVYLASVDDKLHAVGCTASGIAFCREPLPAGASISALLQPKLVAQIQKWIGDTDEDITVSASENLIRLRQEGGQLTSKIYDERAFVDYGRVLIEEHDLYAITDQDALKAALRRALIMADDRSHSVRLTFADGAMTIQARNAQAGEGSDEIPVEYEGPEVSFLLSAEKLEGALSNLTGDRVEFGFAPAMDKTTRSIQVIIRAPADPTFVVNLAQPRA